MQINRTNEVSIFGQVYSRCRHSDSRDAYNYFGFLMVKSFFRATFSSSDGLARLLCRCGFRLVAGPTWSRSSQRLPTLRRVSRIMDLVCVVSAFSGGY